MTASTLTVHCKSKNDDLGEHVLRTGENYSWNFKENFWRSTLFGAILVANIDKLPVIFFGQRKGPV